MKISVISFTRQGRLLAERIKSSLSDREVDLCHKPEEGVVLWAEKQFRENRALVFIGACGIAVRAIAPWVKDKLSDSPVLVLDEQGRYVIPILSGHAGGANELAERIAVRIKAAAVITTATDIHGKFAVDLFAKRNQCSILNKDGIAKVSAKILRGERATISIEDGDRRVNADRSRIPEELELIPYPPRQKVDILVSSGAEEPELSEQAVLRLKPKEYILGIGCKKGKSKEEIAALIQKNLTKLGLRTSEIAAIASIERKREEPGICRWAQENRIPFCVFSEEELRSVQGTFRESAFVEQTVGVGNVCERAALAACESGGGLILEKQAENGITLAVAKRKWKIEWKKEQRDEA